MVDLDHSKDETADGPCPACGEVGEPFSIPGYDGACTNPDCFRAAYGMFEEDFLTERICHD